MLNTSMGKYLFIAASIALLAFALVVDRLFGKGSSDIFFQLWFGAIFFNIAVPLLILGLLPLLKSLLGPAPEAFATHHRVKLWLVLADMFTFDGPSDEEVEGIAREVRRQGMSRKEVRAILETEVGPVCEGRIFRAGDDYHEGVDRWQEDWLRRKILAGTRAYKFIRAIPVVGWYFRLLVAGGRRKQIALLLEEL